MTADYRIKETLTLRIQRQYCLNSDIDPVESVILKHDLAHPLPIGFWVHRWFSEQHFPTSRIDLQLLVKGVVPQELHILPVSDDPVLHGLSYLEEISVLCGFVSDHDILDNGVCVYTFFRSENWPADDGRKDWPCETHSVRSVVSRRVLPSNR